MKDSQMFMAVEKDGKFQGFLTGASHIEIRRKLAKHRELRAYGVMFRR